MSGSGSQNKRVMDRRRFIQSLFGLSAMVDEPANAAKAQASSAYFFWGDLRNGHVGFPGGSTVPAGVPGSVMKIVTAALLKERRLLKGDEKVECRGMITVHGKSYKCLCPHGKVDLVRAIGMSCNVFFATMSQRFSPQQWLDFAELFGLNLPAAGYIGKFPSQAASDPVLYGLGLAADLQPNALQIMRLSALVATSGDAPYLFNPGEEKPADAPRMKISLHAETWEALRQGMRLCAREGTARALDPEDKLSIAAKTGTAPHGKSFSSWVTGYFPYERPAHIFVVRAMSGTSMDEAIPRARGYLMGTKWL